MGAPVHSLNPSTRAWHEGMRGGPSRAPTIRRCTAFCSEGELRFDRWRGPILACPQQFTIMAETNPNVPGGAVPPKPGEAAKVAAEEVSRSMANHLVDRLFEGSLFATVNHLLSSREVSRDELRQLEKLIASRKKKR